MGPQPNNELRGIDLFTRKDVICEARARIPAVLTYAVCRFIIYGLGATQSNGEPLKNEELVNQVFGLLKDTSDTELKIGTTSRDRSIGVALALALIRRLNLIIPTQVTPTIQSQ